MGDRRDIYAEVTNSIIAALEAGTRPWVRPWNVQSDVTRPLRGYGVPYRGINVLYLWLAAAARGYISPYWMTFRQAHGLGAYVRKGERSTLVVYASRFSRTETREDGEITEREIPFLRGYAVFNAERIGGLPAQYFPEPVPEDGVGKDARAETFIRNTGQ